MRSETTSWNNGVQSTKVSYSLGRNKTGVPNANRGNATPLVVAGLVVVGGILAYFLVVKPLLEAAGLKETKFDEQLPKKNGFNPEYYKEHIGRVTISTQKAAGLADKIYLSSGWAQTPTGNVVTDYVTSKIPKNDDEEMLHGAIQEAGSEYNLSKVSDLFQKKYGKGMISWIKDFADNSDTKAISRIIKEYKS